MESIATTGVQIGRPTGEVTGLGAANGEDPVAVLGGLPTTPKAGLFVRALFVFYRGGSVQWSGPLVVLSPRARHLPKIQLPYMASGAVVPWALDESCAATHFIPAATTRFHRFA